MSLREVDVYAAARRLGVLASEHADHLACQEDQAHHPERTDQIDRRKAKVSAGGRPPAYDGALYHLHNTVEHGFNRLKQWRGIATPLRQIRAHLPRWCPPRLGGLPRRTGTKQIGRHALNLLRKARLLTRRQSGMRFSWFSRDGLSRHETWLYSISTRDSIAHVMMIGEDDS